VTPDRDPRDTAAPPGRRTAVQIVTVLTTEGTIASRADAAGGGATQDTGEQLVSRLRSGGDVDVRVEDVFRVGSYLMTLDGCTWWPCAPPTSWPTPISGLVVTDGTDTTYSLDLLHEDPRPVVVTGAQRAVRGRP
jgi:L-asparaginase